MLILSVVAQGLLLVESLILSAMVTVRTRSVAMGALCLYGLGLLWVLLFAVLVPHVLPHVIEVDLQEIDEVFPTQIRIFPVLLLAWIPALVFASLVHLVGTVANDCVAKPDMRASAGLLKRSLYRLLVGMAQSLRRGLTPARDKPYPRGVGALLGVILPGSAHFLLGRKRAGLFWYVLVAFVSFLGVALLAVPRRWALLCSGAVIILGLLLRLHVLVQSYRPVRRIGIHGWLALLAIAISLNLTIQSVIRLVGHPFYITSEAMSPTVCGVHTQEIRDGQALKAQFLGRLVGGRRYVQWRAATSGTFKGPFYHRDAPFLRQYRVDSDARWLPGSARFHVEPGAWVQEGDLIYSGFVITGDRLLVGKVAYWFRPPRRGEIVVFRTDGIANLDTGEYWVKRVVGLPGERVSIDPPYLVVDGQRITEPPIFELIASEQDGYGGYVFSREGCLDAKDSGVVLGEDEYFVLGDNAANSSDSRYWAPVPRKNIIGRVTRIYWPLDRIGALEGKW